VPVLGRGGAKVTVSLEGAPDCNDCRTRTASSVKVRIFQVADSSAIRTTLNNKTLSWSKQLEAAAANVLGKPTEEYVGPGLSKSVVIEVDPKAVALVIEGNFCEKSGADWYFIHPAKHKSVGLRAGATGFTLNKRK
jgi:predicted component of type VI protein secretion system